MDLVKKLFFFLLMPIFVPLALFLNLTFDWWAGLGDGNPMRKLLFIILLPIYGPLALIFNLAFDAWVALAD
jgi:hypothetical protein